MSTPQRILVLLVPLLGVFSPPTAVLGGQDTEKSTTVLLDTRSFWRMHMTYRPPVFGTRDRAKPLKETFLLRRGKERREVVVPEQPWTSFPPDGWMRSGFDDREWWRGRGPFYDDHRYVKKGYGLGLYPTMALLCLRGKFHVPEPSAVKELILSVRFRGGCVAYLNGREIARSSMPAGKLTFETLAFDYEKEAFVKEDGKWYTTKDARDEHPVAALESRVRSMSDLSLPVDILRKGSNVFALEIHRTAYHPLSGRKEKWAQGPYWSTVGLVDARLRAVSADPATLTPVVAPGLRAWNMSVLQETTVDHSAGPEEDARPIRIVGTRNGAFSGQVIVGAAKAVTGLEAAVGDLKHRDGKGTVPASAVQVRFALTVGREPQRFDVLSDAAPVKVTRYRKGACMALQPVWVTVNVSADAEPGDYEGTLTVESDGAGTLEIPVNLKVCEFLLPDPHDFVTYVDFVESPESVALHYKVPPWSDRHFELVGESLRLLGLLGNKTVYLSLIGRTYIGNEESMVRWVKKDGAYERDFRVFERYLDLAEKHMGKPYRVCLYVWDPYMGGTSGFVKSRRGADTMQAVETREMEGAVVTTVDPVTGEIGEMRAPSCELPEAVDFWKPAVDEIVQRLKKRGLGTSSIMLCLSGDMRPPKKAVDFWRGLLPDVGWMTVSHIVNVHLYGQPVACTAHVGTYTVADPDMERRAGWKRPDLNVAFWRNFSQRERILKVWGLCEHNNICGRRGFGYLDADFWRVMNNGRNPISGRNGRFVPAYEGAKAHWKAFAAYGYGGAHFLAPGPDGAVATVRMEMLRDGLQECEARIFVEKAIEDEATRAELGEEQAGRCRDLLDERTRALRLAFGRNEPIPYRGNAIGGPGYIDTRWFVGSGWQERSVELYSTAADVALRLGPRLHPSWLRRAPP